MKKFLPWVIGGAIVAGLVVLFRNSASSKSGPGYVNAAQSTNSASPFDQFSSILNLIRGTGGPVNPNENPNRTANLITASGAVVSTLPGLFGSISKLFSSNKVPAVTTTPIKPVSTVGNATGEWDWSNLDNYYSTPSYATWDPENIYGYGG